MSNESCDSSLPLRNEGAVFAIHAMQADDGEHGRNYGSASGKALVRTPVLLPRNTGVGVKRFRYIMPEEAERTVSNMSDTVIVSLISLIGSIIVAVISYRANRKGAEDASKANAELIAYRIQQLERKQDLHNSMIERMYKVEGQITELQHEVKDLKPKVG